MKGIGDERNRTRQKSENTLEEEQEKVNDNADPPFHRAVTTAHILIVYIIPIAYEFFYDKTDESLQFFFPAVSLIF